MGRLDTNERLELLRRANAQLRQFFERFSGAPVLGTDEEVEALLQVERSLQSVGALLGDGGLQRATILKLVRKCSAIVPTWYACATN